MSQTQMHQRHAARNQARRGVDPRYATPADAGTFVSREIDARAGAPFSDAVYDALFATLPVAVTGSVTVPTGFRYRAIAATLEAIARRGDPAWAAAARERFARSGTALPEPREADVALATAAWGPR